MTVPSHDFEWEQGDDLEIFLNYKEGPPDSEVVPADFETWQVRMDIRTSLGGTRIWTFNSDDLTDGEADEVGEQDNEAALDVDGNITITVPRSLTLPPEGAIYLKMTDQTSPQSTFVYDVFLRNSAGKQKKILEGSISVNGSVTQWL
jgi:hypothetical protein